MCPLALCPPARIRPGFEFASPLPELGEGSGVRAYWAGGAWPKPTAGFIRQRALSPGGHYMENPVFVNELRQNIFRRKPLLALGLWALATIFLIWLSQFARQTRYPLAWLPVFALPLIVPPFAAGTFA